MSDSTPVTPVAPVTPVKKPRGKRPKAAPTPQAAPAKPVPETPTSAASVGRTVPRAKYLRVKSEVLSFYEENRLLYQQLDEYRNQIQRLRQAKIFLLDHISKSPNYIYDQSSSESDSDLSEDEGSKNVSSSKSDQLYKEARKKAKLIRRQQSIYTPMNGSASKSQPPPPTEVSAVGEAVDPKAKPEKTSTEANSASKKVVKTKRKRQGTNVIDRELSVLDVEREPDGSFKLPYYLGQTEIISLGKVVWDRDAFHTERHIWPLGYQVKRQYRSMTNPNTTTTYTGTILEKDDHPWFLLEAEDNPGHVLEAGSPTGVWTTCVKAANSHRPDPHSGAASGPDYFGLNNPTVAMMVQSLPNVEKCRNYIMKKFRTNLPVSQSRASDSKSAGSPPPPEITVELEGEVDTGDRVSLASTVDQTLPMSRSPSPSDQSMDIDPPTKRSRLDPADPSEGINGYSSSLATMVNGSSATVSIHSEPVEQAQP